MEKVKRFFRSYSKRILAFVLSFGFMCISVLSSPINVLAADTSFQYFDFSTYTHGSSSGINNWSYSYLDAPFIIDTYPTGLGSSSSYKKDVYTTFTISYTLNSTVDYKEIPYGGYPPVSQIDVGHANYDLYLICTTTTGVHVLKGTGASQTYTVQGYPISFQIGGSTSCWAKWNYTNEAEKFTDFKCRIKYTSTSSITSISVTNETVQLPSNITNSITGGSGSSLTGSSDAASTNTSFGDNVTSVNDTSDSYFDSFSTNMDSLDVVSNLSSIGVGFASVKLWMEAFYDKLPTPLQSVIFVSLYVGIIALLLSVIGRIKSHGGS